MKKAFLPRLIRSFIFLSCSAAFLFACSNSDENRAERKAPRFADAQPAMTEEYGASDSNTPQPIEDAKTGEATQDPGTSSGKNENDGQMYTVQDGNSVDPLTYAGYKLYQRVGCMPCHGPTGEGGAAFPNLLESVKRLSKHEVIAIAKNGKGIMPAHKNNSYLASYAKKNNLREEQGFEAVYVYLSARSDGAIPAGRLNKLE